MHVSTSDVTTLLRQLPDHREAVWDELFTKIYEELRRLARIQISREGSRSRLQATELVHEAFFRLVDQKKADWRCREHFYSVAAKAMRRLLVDRARRRKADKRWGNQVRVPLEQVRDVSASPDTDLLDLDRALAALGEIDARQARVVELRYFAGLSGAETAELLEISEATVTREWRSARAWLRRELTTEPGRS